MTFFLMMTEFFFVLIFELSSLDDLENQNTIEKTREIREIKIKVVINGKHGRISQ